MLTFVSTKQEKNFALAHIEKFYYALGKEGGERMRKWRRQSKQNRNIQHPLLGGFFASIALHGGNTSCEQSLTASGYRVTICFTIGSSSTQLLISYTAMMGFA